MNCKLFLVSTLALIGLHYAALPAQESRTRASLVTNKPDPSGLLMAAQQSRHTWQNLPGFTVTVEVRQGAETTTTQLAVDANCELQVTGQTPLPEWAAPKIRSVLSHRCYQTPETESASYVSGSEQHVYGPAITKADGSGQFRIVDNALREVVRRSDDSWLEIDTLKVLLTEEGKNLPEISVVNYRDPQSGNLRCSRTNYYTWTRLGDFYLPQTVLEIELTAGGGKTTRQITFILSAELVQRCCSASKTQMISSRYSTFSST